VLYEPLDRAALAGGVAALEHDDVPVPVRLAPLLQLQQLDLQQPFVFLVVQQHGVVIVVVINRVAVQFQ
jgi:hypothetical protein